MTELPGDLKWYPLEDGQWLVVEVGENATGEQAQGLLDALPEALRDRVLLVVGKAFVLDPDNNKDRP